MIKSNLKTVKIVVVICVALCALCLCYAFYDCMFRHRFLNSLNERFICYYAPMLIISLICVCIIVFIGKILRHLKTGQLFVPNNYRWLLYAAICFFIQPIFLETGHRMIRELELDWSFIPNMIFHPRCLPYIICALILYLFASLYRIGELAAEEQRLTI